MTQAQKNQILKNVEVMAREMVLSSGRNGLAYNWMGWMMIASSIKQYKENHMEG